MNAEAQRILGAGDPAATVRLSSLCRQVQESNQFLMIDGSLPAADDAFLGVPVRDLAGAAIGTLAVCQPEQRCWNQEDLRLLSGLAETAFTQMRRAEPQEQASGGEPRGPWRPNGEAEFSGLIFERRKAANGNWTYTFFDAARRLLPDAEGSSGQELGFIHPDDRDKVKDSLERAMAAKVDVDLTFRVLAADDKIRWLRSQSVLGYEADGTAVWNGLCSDVSDLVAAREAAEAARVATDMLLVDVNHELRTPLQSILGFTELLRTEARPDVVRSHAAIIQTSAQALLGIVNQLLDLASGEEIASRHAERHQIDVRALAETCLGMVAPLAAEKGIASALLFETDVPHHVMADGPKIQQILVNLLNNAIKFTEAGSVELRVSQIQGGLRFNVSDTGIGISQDNVGQLFQRFSRLEPSQRPTRGTGLGLAIAKQLVEAMDGTIGVSSTPGRGTTFWFELGAESVAAPVPVAAPAAAPEAAVPVGGSGARILLADDLDLNRKLIADMLAVEGYEVDCVNDGEAAVQAVSRHAYDLVLMDMIMPGMDGLAATRGIRALPAPVCDVPIIALTAHSFKEQLDSCIEAGMNATLTKPMSLESLVSTVKNWTQGRSQAA